MSESVAGPGSPSGVRPQGPVSTLVCPSCGRHNTIRPSSRGSPHCGDCGAPLAWLVDATDATFAAEAAASPPVVVDLWAPWCGPCRFVSPILEQLAREHAGRLKVIKVNVDDNPVLARRFNARSIPTLVVLKDGQVVERIVGAMPKPQLEAHIVPHLSSERAV